MYGRNKTIGIIAGNFDVIHPGYIRYFRDAKENACEHLVIALHIDPSIENANKLPPVLTVEERTEILMALEYVDEVICYDTEAGLVELLKTIKPSVRVLGSDYRGKQFTGDDLGIPVYYHTRDHNWSTTKFKNEITDQVIKQKKLW